MDKLRSSARPCVTSRAGTAMHAARGALMLQCQQCWLARDAAAMRMRCICAVRNDGCWTASVLK